MVEENISQEFVLKNIDETRNYSLRDRAKSIDEQKTQKGLYNKLY